MSRRWFYPLCLIMILSVWLMGCGNVPVHERIEDTVYTQNETEKDNDTQGPPDFKGIAEALGCVFAPETCNK
jgi:hypothetical protein